MDGCSRRVGWTTRDIWICECFRVRYTFFSVFSSHLNESLLTNSSVFQQYYETHQLSNESPSSIAWIGSLNIYILLASGIFSGPLFDQHGEKVMYPAVVSYIFSVMMTSISTKLWHFILGQGILGGFSMGMILGPAMGATGQYFKKRRAAALGMTVAGSSVGGVIFPIALSKMLANPNLTFGWTVRILGFIMVACLTVTCLTVKARLPPRKGQFLLPAAFKELPYVTLIGAMFFAVLGLFTPFFYLPSYAAQHGMSVQLSSYLAAILNGASFFGRAVGGILADRLGRYNMLCFATTGTGILVFCWPSAQSNAPIIAFSVLYGFFSGAIISLMAVCFMSTAKDAKNNGTYYGMGMAIDSIAALIGPPITGAIVTKYHGFNEAAYFSGAAVLVGAVGALGAKYASGKGFFARV
jgi:MFS family permease